METEITPRRTDLPQIIPMTGEQVDLLIPQCCREGWASCKHVPKKQKKVKRNIGL